MARRKRIPKNWINDVLGDFLRDTGNVPEGILWRTYEMLEVFVPPSEYILALKLLAGRQKDREDIAALCQHLHIRMRSEAQVLVDRYISRRVQQINELNDTLDELFP